MRRSVSVVIVGGGLGGVAAAIALKREGIEDLKILERGERLGGVWRANTYPGATCDVPSHLYSYSFAPNPKWSRRFSPGAEIQAYLEDVAVRFDVIRHLRFGADVAQAGFDEQSGRWQIELADGETLEAEVLVTACGQLSRPSIPPLQGLERFGGKIFHSAHWDHGHDLSGRRVAVLGTGASAIQFVPEIASKVASMSVFQRSAPWVVPKFDAAYAQRTQRLYERVPLVQKLWRGLMWGAMASLVPLFTRRPKELAKVGVVPFSAAARLHRLIGLRGDLKLFAATKPDSELGCKRVLVSSQWYPALRRSNVELVTQPVREVLEDGIVDADGGHHLADTIIFGTGFTATEFLAPMEVRGRDGESLGEAWRNGAEAYLGITVPGFPNLFMLYGPNTNHGTGSAIGLLEAQAGYVAGAVGLIASGDVERLEVRRDVHESFQEFLADRLKDSVWATCSSWYVNGQGRVTNNWPGGFGEYLKRTKRFVASEYL